MSPSLLPRLGLMLLGAFAAAGAADAAPRRGCAFSVAATVDHESFRQAGHDSKPARLSAVRVLTADRFAAAARRLCAAAVLRPADLARLRRIVVQNGEGATEPLLYQEEASTRAIVFQYAFGNGGPPTPAEFEQALRCWKRPGGPGCDFGD